MPAEPAVAVRGLRVERAGLLALADLDLDVGRGEVVAVCGPNGAGKSTLLAVLAGRLPAARGEVAVLGHAEPWALGGRAGRSLRARLGFAEQPVALDPEATVGETMHFLAALYGLARRGREQRCRELAQAFGIADLLGRRAGRLSGGERRRLHLLLAFVHEPELLLLDEPTADLDPDGRSDLWRMLAAGRGAGRAAVVVTHDLAEAERGADRVVILGAGRTLASGAPAALVAALPGECVRIEFDAPPAPELLDRLRACDGARAVAGAGARVEVVADDAGAAQAALQAILPGGGALVRRVEIERRDLAAVYRRTTGGDLPRPGRGTGRGGGRRGR